MGFPFLEFLILLPLAGALLLLFIPEEDEGAMRGATLATSIIAFVASLPLFWLFDPADPGFQFAREYAWLGLPSGAGLGASLELGIDGISLLLILLTTFLVPICVLCSWKGVTRRLRSFHAALLIMEAAMIGVFCARDLLLFFLFFEIQLVPMFLFIGVWGAEDRIRAAVKFFIYTAVGSLMMLAAIAYLYGVTGSFDLDVVATTLTEKSRVGEFGPQVQFWLCLAFALAFAIKVPVFPVHTWLPHAHVQAPTAGSVILAAVMLKMGGYGFIRFCLPLFPDGLVTTAVSPVSIATGLTVLGAIGVVYGSFMALAQADLKRLIAYSSIAHLGLVVIGIFAGLQAAGVSEVWVAEGHVRGVTGATFQMIAHGLSTGALFFLVGTIYDRRHTKEIARLGGLAKPAPVMATCFVVATLASIAVPGTAGFVGEILILLGVYENAPAFAAIGALGMVLGAAYMLWAVQRVFFGPADGENATMPDLDGVELAGLVPLLLAAVYLGLFPGSFLSRIEPAVRQLADVYGG